MTSADDSTPFLTSDPWETVADGHDSVDGSFDRPATNADRTVTPSSRTLAQSLYQLAGEQHTRRPCLAALLGERGLLIDLCEELEMPSKIALAINYRDDFERDERGRIIRLRIPADRVKARQGIDKPVSSYLDQRIRANLAWFRPHVAGSDSPWLFPSPAGGQRSVFQTPVDFVRAAKQPEDPPEPPWDWD